MYVGGLPFGVRQRDIEKFFKGFGKTRDILIKNGYGFVVSISNKLIVLMLFQMMIFLHSIFRG